MNRVYLDIHAVCERYSISTRTVWRRVKKGLLPQPIYFDGPQSGGRWKLADLERLDAERERKVA